MATKVNSINSRIRDSNPDDFTGLDKYIIKLLDFWSTCKVFPKYEQHKEAMKIVLENEGIFLNYIFMSITKKPEAMLPLTLDDSVSINEFFEPDDAKTFRAIVNVLAKLISSSDIAQKLGSNNIIDSMKSAKNKRRAILD